MSSLKTNIIFWLTITYFVTFNLLFYMTGYEVTAYAMAALLFGFSIAVFVTWFSTAVRAFREGGREGEAILAFSICIIAAYAVYTRIWVTTKLALGSPEWMNTSPIGLGASVLLLMFFTGLLLAPGTKGGDVPKINYIVWAVGLFVAGLFFGVMIATAVMGGEEPLAKSNLVAPAANAAPPALSCEDPKPIMVRAFCRARPNMSMVK